MKVSKKFNSPGRFVRSYICPTKSCEVALPECGLFFLARLGFALCPDNPIFRVITNGPKVLASWNQRGKKAESEHDNR
jgi:hypothetical protein